MNLYKISFSHHAPKDREEGIKCLLLAKNDEQVYEWIKSEPEINGNTLYNSWKDSEEENEDFEIYDNNFNLIGNERFKEKIIRLKGQMNDDDYDFSDAYYGITLYGWSLLKENTNSNYSELIDLGIVFRA